MPGSPQPAQPNPKSGKTDGRNRGPFLSKNVIQVRHVRNHKDSHLKHHQLCFLSIDRKQWIETVDRFVLPTILMGHFPQCANKLTLKSQLEFRQQEIPPVLFSKLKGWGDC